jgi:phenylacetate-coenzyme A ligase PaaK-like adenylate-forming protein
MTVAALDPNAQRERVLDLLARLLERESWTDEQRAAHRERELRSLVQHALDASPYYSEALPPDAADRPLAELPTLPKPTLMRELDRIVTDPAITLEGLEAHLAGPEPGQAFRGRYRVFCTSGTTGVRGIVVHEQDELELWVAATMRSLARLGIGPTTRLVGVAAPGPSHWSKQLLAVIVAGSTAPRVSVLTPLPQLVEALNEYQPEAVVGYSSVIAVLAAEQLAGRLRIAPRVTAVSGEVLTEDGRDRVEQAWGAPPAGLYSTTEVPMVAASPSAGAPLVPCDDVTVLEVVDERDRPVPPGVHGHKVLVTSLVNRAVPLIRYELSDSVVIAPDGRIERIDGRSDDVLTLGGVDVHPYRLRAPFVRLPEVREYQIVSDGARLRVRIALSPDAAADTRERVRVGLVRVLDEVGATAPIEVESVEALEREPGPAAKLKLVKRL